MLAVEICQYPWDAIAVFAKELNSPISDDHRSKKRNWWFIFQMIMEWAQNQKNESVKKELAMKLISAHDEWKVNEQGVTKKVVRFKRLARKLDIQGMYLYYCVISIFLYVFCVISLYVKHLQST